MEHLRICVFCVIIAAWICTLLKLRIFKEIEEKMKLGIVAQRPIFTTPYKSINVR